MSAIAWILSIPQFVMVTVVGVYSLRAHRAAQDIMADHPKSAGRLGNYAQLAFLLAVAYVLIQVEWAMSQSTAFSPTLADVLTTAWDLMVLTCLLIWSLSAYEQAKDKLTPTTPCRPCPWRGEGDAHVLPGCCAPKSNG